MILQKSLYYANFAAQETFIIAINVENSCVASYFYDSEHKCSKELLLNKKYFVTF